MSKLCQKITTSGPAYFLTHDAGAVEPVGGWSKAHTKRSNLTELN